MKPPAALWGLLFAIAFAGVCAAAAMQPAAGPAAEVRLYVQRVCCTHPSAHRMAMAQRVGCKIGKCAAARDGCAHLADPVHACSPLRLSTKTAQPAEPWVALLARTRLNTTCKYQGKVLNAEEAGASAALVFNDGPEDILYPMRETPSLRQPTIPSAFISAKSARKVMDLMMSGGDGVMRVFIKGRKAAVWHPEPGDKRTQVRTSDVAAVNESSKTLPGSKPRTAPPTLAPHYTAVKPSQRVVVLAGSGSDIAARWAATMSSLRPGDSVQLAPTGGVLVLPGGVAPLMVPKAITITGANTGPNSDTPAGAARGSVRVECRDGALDALWVRWGPFPFLSFAREVAFATPCIMQTSMRIVWRRPARTALRTHILTRSHALPPLLPTPIQRAPGVVIQDLTISSCPGFAAVLRSEAGTGADAVAGGRPMLLRRVTLEGNEGALLMQPSTAAIMESCLLVGNGALGRYGSAAVWAHPGSALEVVGCDFIGNKRGGMWFEGAALDVKRCRFLENEASALYCRQPAASAVAPRAGAAAPPLYGVARVEGCMFRNNSGKVGGGLHVAQGIVARVIDSLFERNTADFGGGLLVDEGGWLSSVEGSVFDGNHARAHGGGAFVILGGCYDFTARGAIKEVGVDCTTSLTNVNMSRNTARGDGGGLYVEASPATSVNITTSLFEENEAQGLDTVDRVYELMWRWTLDSSETDRTTCAGGAGQLTGRGGALYIAGRTTLYTSLTGVELNGNRAAGAGGALHVCSQAMGGASVAIVAVVNSSFEGNWAGGPDGKAAAGTAGGALHMLGQFLITW
ncbi:MAG: hypothetical protein J3K34DRAFT_457904 [Monoraphidium minutum]|nr:MAG: hypothetical protein J3K34DRAFT_457904 [Monoraphidium minutum]